MWNVGERSLNYGSWVVVFRTELEGQEAELEFSRYRSTLLRMQPKPDPSLMKYLIDCSSSEAHEFLLKYHNHLATGEHDIQVGLGLYGGKDAAYWTRDCE